MNADHMTRPGGTGDQYDADGTNSPTNNPPSHSSCFYHNQSSHNQYLHNKSPTQDNYVILATLSISILELLFSTLITTIHWPCVFPIDVNYIWSVCFKQTMTMTLLDWWMSLSELFGLLPSNVWWQLSCVMLVVDYEPCLLFNISHYSPCEFVKQPSILNFCFPSHLFVSMTTPRGLQFTCFQLHNKHMKKIFIDVGFTINHKCIYILLTNTILGVFNRKKNIFYAW